MRLTTPREPLLHHLQIAASVCPTRSPRPILQDVLIEAHEGRLDILATDGEISVRTRLEHDGISGEGQAALPAATLLSAVRSMNDDEVVIDEKASLHEIRSGTAVFKLNGDDPDDFPTIATIDTSTRIELPLERFLDLCTRTMFAAAKEMGRYAFNGVLLEVGPDEITMVATDGRRLALARLPGKTGVSKRQSRILPLKGLVQLQKAGGDEEDAQLTIGLLENQVAFALPHTEIVAQLVEGEFPDFRAVIPKTEDAPLQVQIDAGEFAGAIRRASVTAGEGARSVELSFGKGSLKISSRQEGVGESRSQMDVEYDGDEVGIRFNPEFLGEYLRALPEPSVGFRFKDRSSAGLFSSRDDSLYVVMPITS